MRVAMRAAAALMSLLAVTSCDRSPDHPAPVILISIDGFRYDFLARGITPTLQRVAADGVRAALVPVFPSKTFPNHYTIVTGLYVEHHGVISNDMYDPVMDAWFSTKDQRAVGDARWYGGEPIWVTAERQGLIAAPLFWPGSEAPIGGRHATYWAPFAEDLPENDRVDMLLEWLALAAPRRPRFATVYFDVVDEVSHDLGPDAPEVDSALAVVDRAIARLLDGVVRQGIDPNILIVSDHGVHATASERMIVLDDYLNVGTAGVLDLSPILQLRPPADRLESVYRALHGHHPNLAVYRREELPARFHFRTHPRIAPIIGVADVGWEITTRADSERDSGAFPGGAHGYDPADPSMHGILLARGPAFRSGITVAPLQNVHLYELMARLLEVQPAPNDGSPDSTRALLRGSAEGS